LPLCAGDGGDGFGLAGVKLAAMLEMDLADIGGGDYR